MTNFALLPIAERSLLAGALFLASVSLLALLLYGILSRAKAWKLAFNGVFFVALTGFNAYVMAVAVQPDELSLSFPWLWLLVIATPLFLYSVCAIAVEHTKRKNVLSPSSVKETLDNLDSGICFGDGNGRIILVNRAMATLSSVLIGSYPQTVGELSDALVHADRDGKIEKISDNLFRFPDCKVWRFITVPFEDKSLVGFTQTTAQDVTEIYATNEEIRAENARIREAIEETKKLMVRLSDRVREQETLALKIKVHNDIGASLIALSQLLSCENYENAEEQLRDLQRAVWHFNTSKTSRETVEDVKKQAVSMGINLVFDGRMPEGEKNEKIFVLAAKECVTNCSKHARGDVVNVKMVEKKDLYIVTITNNGVPPKEEIKEGGGLTSLRQTVENAGGEMIVSHAPEFSLVLKLPRENKK